MTILGDLFVSSYAQIGKKYAQLSFICDPESDLGARQGSKRLKNESSQNRMKPIPLQPAHCVDSYSIFTFSNGRCMRELSHSDRFPKQLKSQQVNWQKSMMMSA
jgi:hypothetical protein